MDARTAVRGFKLVEALKACDVTDPIKPINASFSRVVRKAESPFHSLGWSWGLLSSLGTRGMFVAFT